MMLFDDTATGASGGGVGTTVSVLCWAGKLSLTYNE